MLIITGTGRSGTATMARILGGYHEFRVNYIIDKYFSRVDPCSDPFNTLGKRLAVILDLHQGIERNTFIDASNLYIHFIDAVHMLDPSAKFILTVRDGKDFVRSALSRRWHEQKSFGSVPPRDDPYFDRWDGLSPLQKNAWIWVYRNKKALEGLGSVPDQQRLLVRIEDIHNPAVLDRIEDFAGKKIISRLGAAKRYNANPAFNLPPKEEWSDAMNNEFDEIAGDMMRFFSYD